MYSVFITNEIFDYHFVTNIEADSSLIALGLFMNDDKYVSYSDNAECSHIEEEDKAYIEWGTNQQYYYTIQKSERV